ncbi:HD-GYP domain-containing protein [Ferdinandcohnia quinoae]|uniref:HD-GYP domain-containing protein n=1 Tax=Fredinandcohnia quinoae TaxID=2918902 RepID=A0AAW5E9T4_9BACI|nr:HD-GYP domain-containing protein [Fredinandcohnia sp. SECRCQ15]MCH1626796.1 HD-GYP domain-containing protein [Fredinandcohnia sp. SECRCQ15]
MRIMVNQLQEGCIISKDIFSLTNKPIIPKKTVLTNKHIEVLKSFLIKDVYVESILINGEPFLPTEIIEEEVEQPQNVLSLMEQYLKSVKEYKQLFNNWQAGAVVDVGKVRSIIIPLLDQVLEQPNELFSLYHYSSREEYIFHHSVTVGLLSGLLGMRLQYAKADCNQLAIAGLLSDCGMSKIDPSILTKNTSLSLKEYNEIKKHPLYSYRMIEKISLLNDNIKLAVLQHHERIDGTGYLMGVSGEKLHPYGKIVALADVYSAMTSERPYSSKQSPFKVLEQIRQESFGKFDVRIVDALTNEVAKLSIGTKVKLSNGQSGEIIFIESSNPTRPMIKISDNEFLELKKNRQIFIEEII